MVSSSSPTRDQFLQFFILAFRERHTVGIVKTLIVKSNVTTFEKATDIYTTRSSNLYSISSIYDNLDFLPKKLRKISIYYDSNLQFSPISLSYLVSNVKHSRKQQNFDTIESPIYTSFIFNLRLNLDFFPPKN